MVEHPFRWDFIGLSTDTKPTPATSPKVVNGSTYYTADDSKLYVYCDDGWYERLPLGGGGGGDGKYMVTKELTTADYNDDESNPRCVAMWLLPDGWYHHDDSVMVYAGNYGGRIETASTFCIITRSDTLKYVITIDPSSSDLSGDGAFRLKQMSAPSATPSLSNVSYSITRSFLFNSNVVNNLTSTSTIYPLSANQGKVLKETIDNRVITGAGSPTTATEGVVGGLYEDTTNGKLYICTAVTAGTDPDPDTYTWSEVGTGGGGGLTLSSNDYDYPVNNPSYVNLDNLDGGIYTATENIGVHMGGYNYSVLQGESIMIVKANGGNQALWLTYTAFGPKVTISNNGSRVFDSNIVCEYNLRSNWLETNVSAPTVNTFGYAGKIVTNVDTNRVPHLYVCGGTDPNHSGQYLWYEATLTQI